MPADRIRRRRRSRAVRPLFGAAFGVGEPPVHLHREPVQPRPPVRRHRLARVRAAAARTSCAAACRSSEVNSTSTRSRSDANPNTVTAPTRPPPSLVQHRAAAQRRRRPAEQPRLARAVGVGDLHPRGADLVARPARPRRAAPCRCRGGPSARPPCPCRPAPPRVCPPARPAPAACGCAPACARRRRSIPCPLDVEHVFGRAQLYRTGPTVSGGRGPRARSRRRPPTRRSSAPEGPVPPGVSDPRPTLEGPWQIPPPTVPPPAPSRRSPGCTASPTPQAG